MREPVRVAFFTDSFHQASGVARTSQELEAFARRRDLPFLSVHSGPETKAVNDGSVRRLELARSPVSVRLERNLHYDFFFWRHMRRVRRELTAFGPDLIHLTGPGDVGQLGAWLAHRFGLPLVIGWHTNLERYARLRLERWINPVAPGLAQWAGSVAENQVRDLCLRFHRMARLVFAPPDLVPSLARELGRPVLLMKHGVDCTLFTPARRKRGKDRALRIGFVGRLSAEKNLRVFADIEARLLRDGHTGLDIVFVGDGAERRWLGRHLTRAVFTGNLSGPALANAYADLDILVFPSETDTYGLAVLEAMASGVPAVVTAAGGPAHAITPGRSGESAPDRETFIEAVAMLAAHTRLRREMGANARLEAIESSWDGVFREMYAGYHRLEPTFAELFAASIA